MKRLLSLLFVSLICISLCACQPTPDESFIVNKGDGKLMKTIYGDPAPTLTEPYQAPENWTETLKGKGIERLTIEINADITVPYVLEYPIYDVTFSDYDQTAFENFLKNTVGDVDLFTVKGYEVQQENDTYEYTFASTNEAKRFVDAADYQLNDRNSPFNRYFVPSCREDGEASTIERITKVLLETQAAYDHILNHQSELMTKSDRQYPVSKDKELWMRLFTGDGNSKIYIDRINGQRCNIGYEPNGLSTGHAVDNTDTQAKTTNLVGVTTDLKNAQEQADAWCEKLGLDGWKLENVGTAPINTINSLLMTYVYLFGWVDAMDAGTVSEYDFYSDINTGKVQPEAYLFTYTPTKAGIPTLYYSNMRNVNAYSDPVWTMPYLQVAVDDSGVRAVILTNACSTFGKCLNTNVELLPFEKIQQKFRDYIVMSPDLTGRALDLSSTGQYVDAGNLYRDDPTHEMTTVHIDNIRLGYVKVKKINTDEFMVIPAWCFYGQDRNRYSDGSGFVLDENNESCLETQAGHTFLCINAIDGSIIDLTQGY